MFLSMDNTFDNDIVLLWDLHDISGPRIEKPDGTLCKLPKKYYDAVLVIQPEPVSYDKVDFIIERPSLSSVVKRLTAPVKLYDIISAILEVYTKRIKAREFPTVARHDWFNDFNVHALKDKFRIYADLLLDHSFLEGFEMDHDKLYMRLGS